jgi:hypothetical protein
MEFISDAQKQVYQKISPWLHEVFGGSLKERQDVPAFSVIIGSAVAQIIVLPWRENDATVTIRSYVVTEAEINMELTQFLLRENNNMRFGAFGLDEDNDIFFAHTIVGSTCDKEELEGSAMAVAHTADLYDDQIMDRWGGKRAVDRLRK